MGGAEMGVGGQIKKQKIYKLSESESERAKMRDRSAHLCVERRSSRRFHFISFHFISISTVINWQLHANSNNQPYSILFYSISVRVVKKPYRFPYDLSDGDGCRSIICLSLRAFPRVLN